MSNSDDVIKRVEKVELKCEKIAVIEEKVINVEKYVTNHIPTTLQEIKDEVKENRTRQFQIIIGLALLALGVVFDILRSV